MRTVAAIFNANAHGVTPPRIELARAALGRDHVFVTRSLDDSRAAAAAIAGRYQVVCTGGGDGTFVQAIADLRATGQPLPILFGLRLGSGNAIADVCGARAPTPAGLAADLARARSDEPPGALRLLESHQRLTHSAGAGLDAAYNLDLARIMKAGRASPLAPVLAGGLGMAITAAIATFPRLLTTAPPRMRITAIGPATRISPAGADLETLADGAVLHDGPTILVTGSTCETYGRGVVLLPHTNRTPDRFQVRIATLNAFAALRGLAHILRGTHRAVSGVTDYLVGGVEVEIVDRAPAHTAGEVWWPDAPFTIRLMGTVSLLSRTSSTTTT